MRSSVLAVALSALLPAFGGQKPNPAPANSLHNCTIAGTVTDAENGQPLAGAEIGLSLDGTSSANLGGVTDDNGRFEVKNIPPGLYQVWANDPGYLSMQYGQRKFDSPGQPLKLSAGQNISDIDFHLSREAVITGHVYDENGRPVERVSVQALAFGWVGGKRELETFGSTSTDDRGEFRLYDLAPGQYYVLALYGGPPPAKNTTYSPSYYPGVLDSSTASPITLRAGEEFPGVDFSLKTVGAFHVRGRVTSNASDLPLADVNVRLVPSGGVKLGYYAGEAKATDAQGDFDIPNVLPGSYYLSAGTTEHGKQYEAQQEIHVSDSDVNGAVLVLSPPVTLRGRVRAEGSVNLSRLRVFLRGGNSPYYAMRWPAGVTVKSDGTFTIKDLSDATYTVEIWDLPPNGYLKRATLDGQDVLESGLTVANGQGPGSVLDIVVSASGGRISGVVVLDGKPVNDARVELTPADESKLRDPLWYADAATDQNGDFLIQGIRPGDYRVFAWQKIEEGEDLDPNLLKRFEHRGQEVRVTENSSQTLQLKAIPATETLSADQN